MPLVCGFFAINFATSTASSVDSLLLALITKVKIHTDTKVFCQIPTDIGRPLKCQYCNSISQNGTGCVRALTNKQYERWLHRCTDANRTNQQFLFILA